MSRKIAILSKYPPIEGGVAAKTFWMARGLAKRGHEVHVITHGLDAGREYSIQNGAEPPDVLPGLYIHRPAESMPWHVPEDEEQSLALLDLTIKVIQDNQIQILDTGYLVPYGIIGHLAKRVTGVHHVLRHGGSDIEKFLKKRVLETTLFESIKHADTVVTEERRQDIFEPLNKHLSYQPPYVVDTEAFTHSKDQKLRKRLAYIGKIDYYWQYKGLQKIAEIMQRLIDQFECMIIGQGKGVSDFQNTLGKDIVSKIKWSSFIPPWEMPPILNQLDAIFMLESDFPYPVFSNLALEAICSGTGIITDNPEFNKTYNNIITIDNDEILVINPDESFAAAADITRWLERRDGQRQHVTQLITFQEYIASTEDTYDRLISVNQRN